MRFWNAPQITEPTHMGIKVSGDGDSADWNSKGTFWNENIY